MAPVVVKPLHPELSDESYSKSVRASAEACLGGIHLITCQAKTY